jgi:NAD(P)-dependent dehydrogenase (short-subunit alcohol dehydrogenase family)
LVHAIDLDLSSQKDVRRFAKVVGDRFPRIHYLVNNAGKGGRIYAPKVPQITEDGFEKIMSTNYFG